MKKTISKDLKKYFKEIKKNLYCSLSMRFAFIRDLKNSINDYINNNQNCSIEDIKSIFGSPDVIAREFSLKINPNLIKKAKHYKVLIIICVLVLIVLLVTGGLFLNHLIEKLDNIISVKNPTKK